MAARELTAAIVLAGGRATRLGEVEKAHVTFAGTTLITRTCAALAEADRVVVVGPATLRLPAGVRRVLESPRFGGPACAVAAGLRELAALPKATRVLVLPCDLRHPDAVVAALRAHGSRVVLESAGRMQWASFAAPLGELQVAFDLPAGPPPGSRLHTCIRRLEFTTAEVPESVSEDIDTLADVHRIGAMLPKEESDE